MYYFIINPNARSGKGKQIWQQLQEELDQCCVHYQACLTEYVGHATKLSAEFSLLGSEEEPVTLVAVGGDGTLQEVITGIRNTDHVYFGYIPIGSGNDFCRSMHLPQKPLDALHVILSRKRILNLDVPCARIPGEQYRFGISTGIGYDAAVCQETAVSPVKKYLNRLGMGKMIYLFIALKQLLFLSPSPLSLEMDGNRKFSYEKTYFAAVMNQKYEGGGFKFCPKAQPDDHVLDVIVVEGLSKPKILLCLPTAFFGKHTVLPGVHIFRCKNISLHSEVPLPVHKDGESAGIQREISVSLENRALKVIMPVL